MSNEFKSRKQFAAIHGLKMAYIDEGEGDPIVFLHGNPTSSYLWRNIMPHLKGRGRLIAPDLIGMGDSDKLPNSNAESYQFVEHKKYLFALLEHLNVNQNVILVIHDWGSALGFHWAHQNPNAVKGIAFMEGIAAAAKSLDNMPEGFARLLQGLRSEVGEEMILEKNIFVEHILKGSILRDLTKEEMAEYRRPFANAGEDRRPTLTWPRQIPIAGEPEDVTQIVTEYAKWLQRSLTPKLFVNAEPGALMTGKARDFVRTFPNLTEVTVAGNHFIQEDSPDEIGTAIADWLPD